MLCWAPLFSVAKRTLPQLDAYALGTVRYAIAIVLLVAILAAVEGRAALRYDGRLGLAALAGAVGVAGFNLFVWIGLLFTQPEHAAIIVQLQTALTAFAVWATRGQRPSGFTLACVAAALIGVVLVITKGSFLVKIESSAFLGDALVFLAAVCWVSYALLAARFPAWSPLRYTVLTCIPGGIALALANVVAVAIGVAQVPSFAALANVGWQIVYLSVCSVVLGAIGFNAAVRRLGPLNTMLMLNLVPIGVFAIESALGRGFAAAELSGAALVIAALAANNIYLRKA